MAWYEQIDLDFGTLQDQFTDLIGETTTLLESANNLEIFNLDAMAEQEEQEALAEEEEQEEEVEEEVVYHDDRPATPVNVTENDSNDLYHTVAQNLNIPTRSAVDGGEPFVSPPRITRTTVRRLEDPEPIPDDDDGWAVDTSIAFTSAMPTAEKPSRHAGLDTEDDGALPATPSKLDVSYNWEGLESLPAKTAKLHVKHHAADSAAQSSTAGEEGEESYTQPITAAEGGTEGGGSSHSRYASAKPVPSASAAASAATTKKAGVNPPLPASVTNSGTTSGKNTTKTGRKVKTLKPKEKVNKGGLDFFGVGSKREEKKQKVEKQNVTESNKPEQKKRETAGAVAPADGLFGALGLFDDIGYDDEPAPASSTILADSVEGVREGYSPAGPGSSAHAQRLPLGWLSSVVGSSATDDGSTIRSSNSTWGAGPSFFDDIEADLDDPILKQVEFNRLNPHAAAQQRAAAAMGQSSINKVLDMWNSFMATDSDQAGIGAGSDAAGGAQSPVSPMGVGANISGSGGDAVAREPYVPGTGPESVLTVLYWYRRVCGITLTVTRPDGSVLYAASRGDTTPPPLLGTIRRRVQDNLTRVTFAVFSVTLPLPADQAALTIAVFALHLLKLVLLTLLSLLLRCLVVLGTFLYICIGSIVAYISGTSAVQRVVNSDRLQRFLSRANDRLNTLLGRDADGPSAESAAMNSGASWWERCTQRSRQYGAYVWGLLNSNNGLIVLTGVLFLFTYYKFQRYGTDAGD